MGDSRGNEEDSEGSAEPPKRTLSEETAQHSSLSLSPSAPPRLIPAASSHFTHRSSSATTTATSSTTSHYSCPPSSSTCSRTSSGSTKTVPYPDSKLQEKHAHVARALICLRHGGPRPAPAAAHSTSYRQTLQAPPASAHFLPPPISIFPSERPSSTSFPPLRTWLGPSGPTPGPPLPSSERPMGMTGGREGGLDRLPVSNAVTQTTPGMHMLYQLQQQQQRQQQEQQQGQHQEQHHHHHQQQQHQQQRQHQEQQPRRGGPTPQTQSAWHRNPSHPSLVAASVAPRTQAPQTGGGQRMGRGEEGVRKEGRGDQDGTFLSRIAAFLQKNTLQGTKPRATLHTWHHWGQYHGQDGTKGLLPLLSVLMQVSLPPSRPPSTAARTFHASGGEGRQRGCEEVSKGGDGEGMVTQKTTDWERGGGEGRFEGRKMREMMRARWLAIKSQTLRQEKGKGGGGGKGGGNRTDASPSDEERMLTFLRVGKGISHCGPACCTIGFHRDAGVSVDVNGGFENRFMSRNSLQASTLIPPLLWQQCIASESRDAYVDIFLNLVFGPSPVPTEVRSELLVQDRGGVIVPARVCLRYFVSDNGNMHAIMLAIEPYR
ncbi:hypothetical protein NSK_002059 [Nannochloropsis salina CCMP1776]|uniref:Uncharacterized protein n=1 Tax=Nannochloropsis salina CCMP1776 TaxID=1027361 RepID=A0A4D9D4D5_9STRA|nr:hypothetical protein NSK_002059 [Nannochloropsis salina CCMP1776]|eukprot:TFJ86402.1 hypothetical protein NSK_002059 [Nannochloropsis salina CCMP1776]